MKKIFINYSWKHNQEVAKELYDYLKKHPNLKIWMDKEDLDAGMKWKPAIRKAIRESDYFISILSEKSIIGRGVRNKEIYEALDVLKEFPPDEIFLIPTLTDECDPPFEEMHDLNWVKLFPDKAAGYKSILEVVAPVAIKQDEDNEITENTGISTQLGTFLTESQAYLKKKITPCLQFKLDKLVASNSEYAKPREIKISSRKGANLTFNDCGTELNDAGNAKDLGALIADFSTIKYHYRVGLVNLDKMPVNLNEIVSKLNEIQTYFHFNLPVLPKLKQVHQIFDGIENFAVYKVPQSYIANHPNYAVDLMICLTKYPLAFEDNDTFLHNYYAGESIQDERFMFLSGDQLNAYCKTAGCKLEEGIVAMLVGQLIAYFTTVGYHSKTRGCVMDFCENRADIIESLRHPKLCSFCSKKIEEGPFKDAITELLNWTVKPAN